jgi:hypothetical protein
LPANRLRLDTKLPLGLSALETLGKERRGSIRDTNDLVSCLPIEFKVELSSRLSVIPVGKMLELTAPRCGLSLWRRVRQQCPL